MQHLRLGLASSLIVFLAGCESGTGSGPGISGPPPAYEDISGQYSAPVLATSTGLVAGLSVLDKVVVMSHDVEVGGPVLTAALDSRAGYIAACHRA